MTGWHTFGGVLGVVVGEQLDLPFRRGNMKNTTVAPIRIATIPAVYAQFAPSTNEVFAALVICFAYGRMLL